MRGTAKAEFSNASVRGARRKREVAKPYCIRLTPYEKARLKQLAGNQTVSAYIRERCLRTAVEPRQGRRIQPDQVIVARLLAMLGQSRLASNLNQIAKAANLGTLPVDDDLLRELDQACSDIRTMRRDLIAALGVKPQE